MGKSLRIVSYIVRKGICLSPIYQSLTRKARSPKPLLLCIEDEPAQLTVRKAVLEQDGYNVIGVSTGEDALKALRDAPVCAVIADHMLQRTTGMDLVTQIKKIKPKVPIILFSGSLPMSLNGVDVYVNKGEATADFLRIVRNVVDR